MIRLPATEYTRRRQTLMAQMSPNSIALLPAAAIQQRNGDVEQVYRQDSDFQYLSGFPEPEAVLVLIPGRSEGEYVLFCRKRDPLRELWDGKRAGQEGAVRDFGADQAFPIDDIDTLCPACSKIAPVFITRWASMPPLTERLRAGWKQCDSARVRVPRRRANLSPSTSNYTPCASSKVRPKLRSCRRRRRYRHARIFGPCKPVARACMNINWKPN